MKLSVLLIKLGMLLAITAQKTCDQKLTTYNHENFKITYPRKWMEAHENGIFSFYPKGNKVAVTISYRADIDFPLDKTKDFIIEMHELNQSPEEVAMKIDGEVAEFYFEHIDENVKWVTKILRKNDWFCLLTFNCNMDEWNPNANLYAAIIKSFKVN